MKIIITAPINNTGIGIMNKEIVLAMSKIPSVDLSYVPVGNIEGLDNKEQAETIQNLLLWNKKYDQSAISLVINQPATSIGHTTAKRALFTVFELDNFTTREKVCLSSQDVIITPSQWGVDILKSRGYNNSTKAPLGVNYTIFNPAVKSSPRNTYRDSQEKFIVYFAGKLEKRKGIDVALRAFNYAFSGKDNVEFWLSCHNMFMPDSDYQAAIKREILNPTVNKLWYKTKVLPRVQTQRDLAEIMSQTNCGLFCSRAEGWGLESAEMISMNKPCIMTNYSAHTEYNDYFYRIPVKFTEPANDGVWFHGHGNWATLDEQVCLDAATALKNLYLGTKLDIDYSRFTEQYTWYNTCQHILKALEVTYG